MAAFSVIVHLKVSLTGQRRIHPCEVAMKGQFSLFSYDLYAQDMQTKSAAPAGKASVSKAKAKKQELRAVR